MGRKKIDIKPIERLSQRKATFEKRRVGLFKKAMELSILTESVVSLTIQKSNGELQVYSSHPFEEYVIERFKNYVGTYKLYTNDHIDQMIPGKGTNNVGHTISKTIMDANNMNNINDNILSPQNDFNNILHGIPAPPTMNFVDNNINIDSNNTSIANNNTNQFESYDADHINSKLSSIDMDIHYSTSHDISNDYLPPTNNDSISSKFMNSTFDDILPFNKNSKKRTFMTAFNHDTNHLPINPRKKHNSSVFTW